MSVLAVDIGGSNLKFRTQHHKKHVSVPSGPKFTPRQMITAIAEHTAGWKFDRVTLGYPGPVANDRPLLEPHNLGGGWARFDYAKAFKRPVRMINDAAMQALGAYRGGRMLFLGLGTGLGSALVLDGVVQPMELAHLSWRKGKTFEEHLGEAALLTEGKKAWRKTVTRAIEDLSAAFLVEYIVIGGGNAKRLKDVPDNVFIGSNADAFVGAFRVWDDHVVSPRRISPRLAG
ncbi:MAG: ROK family protein [Myxococcota bacterium]